MVASCVDGLNWSTRFQSNDAVTASKTCCFVSLLFKIIIMGLDFHIQPSFLYNNLLLHCSPLNVNKRGYGVRSHFL